MSPGAAPDDGAPDRGGSGNSNGDGGTPKITLALLSAEIFTPRCATSGCHSGSNPARGLSLEVDRIASEIINVDSKGSDLKHIDPGNPEGSYLFPESAGRRRNCWLSHAASQSPERRGNRKDPRLDCGRWRQCSDSVREGRFASATYRLRSRFSTTDGSARVEVSPISSVSLVAILRRMRRIILPERVFGRFGAQ